MQENLMSAEIDQLDIAADLKELLVSKGFTNSDEIIKMDPDELASILGTDLDVAKLVQFAAKKN
jgi:transcription termination factor NusA